MLFMATPLTRSARMKSPVSEGSMYPSLSSSNCLWSNRMDSSPNLSSVATNKASYSDSGEQVDWVQHRRAKNTINVLVRVIISMSLITVENGHFYVNKSKYKRSICFSPDFGERFVFMQLNFAMRWKPGAEHFN